MTPFLVFLGLLLAYYLGRLEVKLDLKKIAYKKRSKMSENDPRLLSDYNKGLCDGMKYLVEEVTNEYLRFWR